MAGRSVAGTATAAGLPRNAIRDVLTGHEPRLTRAAEVAGALGFEFRLGSTRQGEPHAEQDRESPPGWATQLRAALESHAAALRAEKARTGVSDRGASSESPAPATAYLSVPFVSGITVSSEAGRLGYHEVTAARLLVPTGSLPSSIESNRGLVCIRTTGDALAPELRDGDAVLLDSERIEPVNGGVFVVYVQNRLLVRRLRRSGDSWLVTCDRPENERGPEPVELDGDTVRVLGRVVWWGSLGLQSLA